MSDEPTRLRNHVTRSKRVKLSAVMAADMVGIVAAAKQTGIPESSIRVWRDKPEYAEIRARTREELAEDVKLAAILTWQRVIELAPTMEARDAIFASDKATTILQLLTGAATSRAEFRDVTDAFDDHEKDALSAILREAAEGIHAGD